MSTRTQVIMLAPRARTEARGEHSRRGGRLVKIEVEPDERLALTVNEAARRIGIGRTLMYDLIAAGRIPTVHIGRAHRIRVEDLVAFLERQVSRPSEEAPAS